MPTKVIGVEPGSPSIYSPKTHFYDAQTRRYLLQFMRLFSGILVWIDVEDETGADVFRPVPIRFAGGDRQAQSIINRNTENAVPALPAMFCSITGISIDAERRLTPSYEEEVQLIERANSNDPVVDRPGRRLSVQRLMPSPYGLTCALEIHTTNVDTKLQIWEQIAAIFNPMLELSASDSTTDWGRLTQVVFTDIAWTTRSYPFLDDMADVMTLTFTMPIWVSLPVRVSRQVLISEVRNVIRRADAADDASSGVFSEYFDNDSLLSSNTYGPTRNDLTVDGRHITLGGQYTRPLLGEDGNPLLDGNGNVRGRLAWSDLFNAWNQELVAGRSRLVLRVTDDSGRPLRDVVVWITPVDGEPDKVSYRVDRDTLEENDHIVQAVVDPVQAKNVSNLSKGLYLLVGNDPPADWGGSLVPGKGDRDALQDDIINLDGNGNYEIVFHAWKLPEPAAPPSHNANRMEKRIPHPQSAEERHVFNGKAQTQFRWQPSTADEAGHWHSTVNGYYLPGNWKVMP